MENGFSNGLTPAENERLALLSEEIAEVQQVIGKIQRHGYQSKNPLEPASGTNRELLENELGHVDHAIRLMKTRGDINMLQVEVALRAKARSVQRWLHYDENKTGGFL